jgi:hypothetical protein
MQQYVGRLDTVHVRYSCSVLFMNTLATFATTLLANVSTNCQARSLSLRPSQASQPSQPAQAQALATLASFSLLRILRTARVSPEKREAVTVCRTHGAVHMQAHRLWGVGPLVGLTFVTRRASCDILGTYRKLPRRSLVTFDSLSRGRFCLYYFVITQ